MDGVGGVDAGLESVLAGTMCTVSPFVISARVFDQGKSKRFEREERRVEEERNRERINQELTLFFESLCILQYSSRENNSLSFRRRSVFLGYLLLEFQDGGVLVDLDVKDFLAWSAHRHSYNHHDEEGSMESKGRRSYLERIKNVCFRKFHKKLRQQQRVKMTTTKCLLLDVFS